jgi:hydrogenase nickel incorporation protein HypA/HybF
MHELSIALSIVDLAEEESELRGGLQIKCVHLKLGQLAGVVKEALLSSYEMARENTALAGSELIIEDVPAAIYCRHCDTRRLVDSPEWFRCSGCGSLSSEVVQGKELEVVSLEVRE